MRSSLFIAILSVVAGGCQRGEPTSAVKEQQGEALRSGEVRLDAEAQRMIGLKTGHAKKRNVDDALMLTGWLTTAPGNEAVVKALASGFVTMTPAPDSRPLPVLGATVQRGASLASLQVFQSPQEQAQLVAAKEEADTIIEQSRVTIRLVGDQLERYRTAKESISGARLLELQEMYEKAQAAYREAMEKLPYLPSEPYASRPDLKPVEINSPITGRVTAVHVAPRQFVVAGDPLWTVSDWSQLWLRVPVFETDLTRVANDAAAQFSVPGSSKSSTAVRIVAPQATDATRRTIDLFYLVENAANDLRPGQAVGVTLPTSNVLERLVVSLSAILWDGRGGTWVYVRHGDDEFLRQRVELGRRLGEDVVVLRGLSDDAEIVIEGAQSLYGEEFKSAVPVDDDD